MSERSSYDFLPIPVVNEEGVSPGVARDCGESLVPAGLLTEHILARPMYFVQKLPGALAEVYLRTGVLQRLTVAAGMLPSGYRLVILDGWRSLRLQKTLFDIEEARMRDVHADWTDEQIRAESRRYIAFPSEDPEHPSGHNTGGAVDLTIAGPDGLELWMGTGFDDTSEKTATRWFERSPEVEGRAVEALCNRRLLYHAMISAGFVNYADEWWHYDYGNPGWARLAHADPFYGATRPVFPWRCGDGWM